ncbi:CPBP family intramembrane metalloprotease [Clostridium botulinum]|uniref:CAAX protease n=1 Tax=Clostridium botulinum C/D str. DC5 TaxID=1443128 RepID=A0A0A0INN5_CLOBO|nr:type II CAAX endopeptidase family protein [Clostridium botulinum]KEI03073.1 CAAX protease [Clostridium botulinum C/D str. BKT75002]KEI13489.1 CAAX protease [Clostridium botulinum C/D str. BKT2873]KGM94969.1 CAAX protease [Clostridium botulinum D str. CCUG 7971]KGN01757.1 CAAX protease [Clostridium botulinum C/D str. DC5]KOC49302.1 CAAX protease [Clostridium botulinum]
MNNNKVLKANFFGMMLLILYSVAPTLLLPILKYIKLPIEYNIVVIQVVLLLVPTIIYFSVTKYPIKNTLRLNKIGFKSALIIIIMGIIAQPIIMFLSLITQFIFPNRIGEFMSQLNSIPLIAQVMIIAATPAIFEEITVRGVILGGYEDVDIKKAAIMTGLFFAMLHRDGNQALYTFVLGFIFAYLVKITNSIFSSMICHFTINGISAMISFLSMRNFENKVAYSEGIKSIPYKELIFGTLFWLIIAIICIKIVMLLIRKLIKINNFEQINNANEYKNLKKIMNWPVYVSLVIYIITIIIEIKSIYK